MASAVDICNLALSHLGDSATVSNLSPPDGSSQAEHCARFYPIARDFILEQHTWKFATRRIALAQVANSLTNWQYAYLCPNQCVKEIAVLLPDSLDDTKTQDFMVEADSNGNKIIYTNVSTAWLRFIIQVTDTTKFSPSVVVSLSLLLASMLAGPVVKGKAGQALKQSLYSEFKTSLELAKGLDADSKQTGEYRDYVPSTIAARA